MKTKMENEKDLRSREPQVVAKPGATPSLPFNYTSKIKVGARVVGEVVGDEFVKKVHSKRHFLRKPPAIAFDIESIETAKSLGATSVKIVDLDTGIIYQVTISLLLQQGFLFNRGFGNQIGLPLKYWSCQRLQQPLINLLLHL